MRKKDAVLATLIGLTNVVPVLAIIKEEELEVDSPTIVASPIPDLSPRSVYGIENRLYLYNNTSCFFACNFNC